MLGTGFSSRQLLVETRAGGFEFVRSNRFVATTDENGVAIIDGLSYGLPKPIHAAHKQYEMPISNGDRIMNVKLKRDSVTEITIKMQKKGSDALGVPGHSPE